MKDPGFDFSLGMFSMDKMASVGKRLKRKATDDDAESKSSDEDEIKEEPEDDDGMYFKPFLILIDFIV